MALEANQPIRLWKRIGILALGLTGNAAMVYGYDFIVYPYLMVAFGPIGWLYAILGAVTLCLGTLWFYDVTQQDWLGIETIKLVRDGPARSRAGRFLQWVARRGDLVTFLLLSLRYDPFITTVYMRQGSGNHTMTARDWKIFWASTVVANVWWGLLILGAIEAFKSWLSPLVSRLTNLFSLA
ncbi:MAG TPA: hypothetical protein VJK73_01870 [Candidatus Paceibacterota bacterium]